MTSNPDPNAWSKSDYAFLFLCLPCICVGLVKDLIPSARERREKKESKRMRKEIPPPLKPRKRSLTPSFPSPKKKSAYQEHSSLLMLPGEIRTIIWEEALGGNLFHIVRMYRKLSHVSCTMEAEQRVDPVHHRCWGFYSNVRNIHPPLPSLYEGPRTGFSNHAGSLLPLLKTCRQIYTEAIDLLYTHNLFDLNHLATIQYLSSTVLPRRFNEIRSLQLTWDIGRFPDKAPQDEVTWNDTWRIIAGMRGLRSLRIILYESGRSFYSRVNETKLLDPLYAVRQVKEFEVEMARVPQGWPTRRGAPFVLKEPEPERKYCTLLIGHLAVPA